MLFFQEKPKIDFKEDVRESESEEEELTKIDGV